MQRKKIKSGTTRNLWLAALQENDLVRFDSGIKPLTDKLYFYNQLKDLMGEEVLEKFHPKTRGFQELVQKARAEKQTSFAETLQALLEVLHQEFPQGFIVKPTTVINTGGESNGYWFSEPAFVNAWENENKILKTCFERTEPFIPELTKILASGEELCFQASVAELAGASPKQAKSYPEIRIHSYEGQVLRGASYSRWKINPIREGELFFKVQDFCQSFLDQLPAAFLDRQAWAFDVMIIGDVLRIIEINTTRGRVGQWSGFLTRPELIQKYTLQFERTKNVRFVGWNGFVLRNGFGNYLKSLKKKYIEGIE